MFAPRLFNCVLNYVQESYSHYTSLIHNKFKRSDNTIKMQDIIVDNILNPTEAPLDNDSLNFNESRGDYLKSKYNPNVDWWSIEIENANNFNFTEVIPKDDRDFWVGKSCYIKEVDENGNINEVKTILHVKTNLVLSIDGELLGRNVNGEFVDVNNLPLDVKVWYQRCGF
jgi:hypothetical protein